MKPIPLKQLAGPYGIAFTEALRHAVRLPAQDADDVQVWPVGEAKDHLSELLNRVRDGHGQLVRRRKEDPVLMMSLGQLADFVQMAAPKRRFADLIAHDPTLPVAPLLSLSETPAGRDDVEL